MIVIHLSKCSLAIRTVSLMHKHLSIDLTAFSLIFQRNKKERDWGRLLSLNVKSPLFNFDEGCQRETEREREGVLHLCIQSRQTMNFPTPISLCCNDMNLDKHQAPSVKREIQFYP